MYIYIYTYIHMYICIYIHLCVCIHPVCVLRVSVVCFVLISLPPVFMLHPRSRERALFSSNPPFHPSFARFCFSLPATHAQSPSLSLYFSFSSPYLFFSRRCLSFSLPRQASQKITNEAPKGIRANLIGSLHQLVMEQGWESSSRPRTWKK